jgi:hypothetical protein
MRPAVVVGAVGLVVSALALSSPPTSVADVTAGPTGAGDPLAVYFRHDAVGRNMRHLAATTCGTERWSVKTATDDDRHRIHLHADDVTIRYLLHRDEPATKPQTSRVAPVELHTYRVQAHLKEYVREDDGDYHLVLADGRNRHIVVEIPDPSCVGLISPVKPDIRKARNRFNNHYTATTSFQSVNRRVIIKGIGFFDFYHGQTGMAPNNLELHPVTGIRFP